MNERKYHFISRSEIIIILIVLTAALIALFALRNLGAKGSYAVIQCEDEIYTVNLNNPSQYIFEKCKDCTFEVSDGKISIIDSPCKDKICVNTGYIGNASQSIICAPEKIIVTIKSDSNTNNLTDVTVG